MTLLVGYSLEIEIIDTKFTVLYLDVAIHHWYLGFSTSGQCRIDQRFSIADTTFTGCWRFWLFCLFTQEFRGCNTQLARVCGADFLHLVSQCLAGIPSTIPNLRRDHSLENVWVNLGNRVSNLVYLIVRPKREELLTVVRHTDDAKGSIACDLCQLFSMFQ